MFQRTTRPVDFRGRPAKDTNTGKSAPTSSSSRSSGIGFWYAPNAIPEIPWPGCNLNSSARSNRTNRSRLRTCSHWKTLLDLFLNVKPAVPFHSITRRAPSASGLSCSNPSATRSVAAACRSACSSIAFARASDASAASCAFTAARRASFERFDLHHEIPAPIAEMPAIPAPTQSTKAMASRYFPAHTQEDA